MPEAILPGFIPKAGAITKYAIGRKQTIVNIKTTANIVPW